MTVAIAVGRDGIDALLVASQVVLSIVLPFITFPLIWCTASKSIMRVAKPRVDTFNAKGSDEEGTVEYIDYSNSKFVTGLALLIWLVIVTANMYVIVTLGMGKAG
jgi:metal iron transporter